VKVAIVASVLSHFEIPLFRLAASLPGMDVRVFHTDPSGDAFYDKDYGQVIDWGENLHAGYPSEYFPTMVELETKLFAWKPNVVMQYGYGWKGAIGLTAKAKLRRVPVVHRGLFTFHRDPRSTRFSKLRRGLRDVLLRSFDAHHFGGSYSKKVLQDIGFPENRCYFVPYSVDTSYFAEKANCAMELEKSMALRKSLGWSADDRVAMMIGNQAWVKGADIFIHSVAKAQERLPDLKVVVVGSGPMLDSGKHLATDLLAPGSFHFSGFIPSKSTVPYYLSADIVVFPSRYDTWARAVNEAMLCRRPCITSAFVAASGGLVDAEENGHVLGSLDADEWATTICHHLALSPDGRRDMGERARAKALEFSYEAHVDDLRRSFTDIAR
jgi:glycosyltransferase involved in cell wall biosynthesis